MSAFTYMFEARGADAIDAQLHEERPAGPRVGDVADGAFVLEEGEP